MGDETKNGAEFLVTVPFDTKKRLSCTIKPFPTLVKETLDHFLLHLSKYCNREHGTQSKILFLKLWQAGLENL